MKLVCIESPFRPKNNTRIACQGRFALADLFRQNILYAMLAVRDSLERSEAPFASHLLYTQVWAEEKDLRLAGIRAGLEYHRRADLVVTYEDLGVSDGMRAAVQNANDLGVPVERRSLFGTQRDPRAHLQQLQWPHTPFWIATRGVLT